MPGPAQKSTGRLIGEGGVVVFSILIAFGVDAWWEYRGERVRERESIEQLVDEFVAIDAELAQLDSLYTLANSGEQRLKVLMAAMGSRQGDFPDLTLDSLIAGAIGNPRASLPEGVLASLLASGDLSLIRSDRLRAALAGWAPERSKVEDDLIEASEFTSDFLMPYLWGEVSVRAIDVKTGYHEELGPGPFDHDPWQLLVDRRFENLINERLILVETNAERAREARAHAQTVLRLARAELSR